jgi:hypothetical protein
MKRLILFTLFLSLGLNVFSQQVDDFVFLEAGYSNQSYYSLANEEVANVDNTDWDIALDADPFGVSIRINGQMGTALYLYPNGDISDWASLDTTGLSEWPQLYDSDNYWEEGAFNQNVDPDNTFDYGWGIYNSITHHVVGDSLYVIKLSDNSYRKIWIVSMISNVFTFKFAELDGSNETEVSFAKGDYSGKNFGYYSIQTEEEIDREPASDTWDIVFTKYYGIYSPPDVYYAVTGALHNRGLMSAQADGVNVDDAIWTDYTMNDTISTIGWDWKSFNMGTFSYDIVADQCFFVVDQNSTVWKIIFTAFIGSSTGEIDFTKEEVGTFVGIEEISNISGFTIYPNPSTNGNLTLNFNTPSSSVIVRITDLSGKEVLTERLTSQGNQSQKIDIADLSKGMYIVSLENGSSKVSQKLIIN